MKTWKTKRLRVKYYTIQVWGMCFTDQQELSEVKGALIWAPGDLRLITHKGPKRKALRFVSVHLCAWKKRQKSWSQRKRPTGVYEAGVNTEVLRGIFTAGWSLICPLATDLQRWQLRIKKTAQSSFVFIIAHLYPFYLNLNNHTSSFPLKDKTWPQKLLTVCVREGSAPTLSRPEVLLGNITGRYMPETCLANSDGNTPIGNLFPNLTTEKAGNRSSRYTVHAVCGCLVTLSS